MNSPEQTYFLTQFSRGAGCGCKISPAILKEILRSDDSFPPHPGLIVGNDTNDDAAVLDLGDGRLLISTTDFFMPVVDDAFDFGRIAATNALSDVYAMGGTPVMALAILGWPVEKIPAQVAQRVLEGARFMCRMAGIPLAGGHSIDSAEPIFGLSVNGIVSEKSLKKNNTSHEGDLIFITKPIGVGIVTTAAKRGLARQADVDLAISYMCTLNKFGETLGAMNGVNALTDITGFGLIGHLIEMCEGANLSARISFDSIPQIPGLNHYLDQFIYPDMTMKNFSAYSNMVNQLDAKKLFVMCDPQTSGGLMVAVSPKSADEYLSAVNDFGLQGIADQCIGRFTTRAEKLILVE